MTVSWRSLLLLLCLMPAIASAQNIDEDEGIVSTNGYGRTVGLGMGASYRNFLDQGFSDILYHRAGATATLSNMKTDATKYTELSFQASYLKMNRKADDLMPGTAKSFKGVFDYRHAYKINFLDESKFDVRVGAILSGLFDYRKADHLNNSALSYDYALSLGAHGKIAKQQYMNERTGYFIWDFSIPFISAIARPPFNNTAGVYNPDYNGAGSVFAHNQVATFGRFFRLTSRVHMLYPLKNGNKFRFTYQWDYYKMRGATSVYSVEHSLTVAFLFNY